MPAFLLIIRGLPGSGKSTLARKLQESGWCWHEADHHMLNAEGAYEYSRDKLRECHKRCYQDTVDDILAGRNVVVSNTFCRKWEMDQYTGFCIESGIQFSVVIANGKYDNVHNVPAESLIRFKERFEP